MPGCSETACSPLAGDRHLELSAEGRQIATRVMRKHRLAERLLLDVVGLEWEYVHEEACRWEHVMSERVERKILALIGEHRESPYGNPIPGLDELGEEPNEAFRLGVTSLLELAGDASAVVVVRRIGEPAQVDHEALSLLTAAGLLPGAAGAGAPPRRPRHRRPRRRRGHRRRVAAGRRRRARLRGRGRAGDLGRLTSAGARHTGPLRRRAAVLALS